MDYGSGGEQEFVGEEEGTLVVKVEGERVVGGDEGVNTQGEQFTSNGELRKNKLLERLGLMAIFEGMLS